jgi:hypothetical protein
MSLQDNFNGQILTQPGSLTKINSTALNAIQVGYSGIVAVVGSCQSGRPKTPILVTSPGQLKGLIGSGNAYDAARAVFTPSTQIIEGNTVRPQLVYVVRADAATQSAITLNDGASAASIVLTSNDFGTQTNQLSVAVASSTVSQTLTPPTNDTSKLITISSTYTGSTEVYDNLGVGCILSVEYTGNGSTATLTTSATQMTTTISGQSDGSVSLTIPYASYATIQQIADYINAQPGYLATVYISQPTQFLGADLDYVSAQNIKTPVSVNIYAVVHAIVTTINSVSSLVTAVRTSPGNLPPANTSAVFFTGGSVTAPSNSDFTSALNSLTNTRVNFLMCATDVTIGNGLAAVFSAFADAMQGKNEMHVHLGSATNLTLANLQTLQASINDVNCNIWFQNVQWTNDQGLTTSYSPWMMAAFAAGLQGGTFPGTSFVQKSFAILGATQNTGIDLNNNADQLILARLSFVRFNDATKSWNVVRALTSYSQDSNDFNIEPGIRSAVNFAVFNIRQDIQVKFLGGRTLYSEAGSLADSAKSELVAYAQTLSQPPLQVIIPGTSLVNGQVVTLPALIVDSVTVTNDILRLRYAIRPIGSINFINHEISLSAVQMVATS